MSETAQDCSALDLVRTFNHAHLALRVEDRWGLYGTCGRGLRFTPSGLARLGSVFGWLEALAVVADSPAATIAKEAAKDIVNRLDRLSRGCGTLAHNDRVPSNVIVLDDDGTLHGWQLQWFGAIHYPRDDGEQRRRIDAEFKASPSHYFRENGELHVREAGSASDPSMRCVYRFLSNGGLLYHGPGGDEVFAVDLGQVLGERVYWSVHT